MDISVWGIEIWQFFVNTFNQLAGPYAEELGIIVAAVIVLGLFVKLVIEPIRK